MGALSGTVRMLGNNDAIWRIQYSYIGPVPSITAYFVHTQMRFGQGIMSKQPFWRSSWECHGAPWHSELNYSELPDSHGVLM